MGIRGFRACRRSCHSGDGAKEPKRAPGQFRRAGLRTQASQRAQDSLELRAQVSRLFIVCQQFLNGNDLFGVGQAQADS
jgi:hypothetical protein